MQPPFFSARQAFFRIFCRWQIADKLLQSLRKSSPAAGREMAPQAPALRRQPGALHQPRTVLAAFQPPRARGSRQRTPSAAGAGALPVDLGQQPRRILHGARRRPQGPGAPRHPGAEPGRADADRAARAHRRSGLAARARSAAALARIAARTRRRRRRADRRRAAQEGRARLAGGPFPPPHLPVADAAGDRSGASVPVHSQSRLLDRAPARAREATARR